MPHKMDKSKIVSTTSKHLVLDGYDLSASALGQIFSSVCKPCHTKCSCPSFFEDTSKTLFVKRPKWLFDNDGRTMSITETNGPLVIIGN